MAAGDGMYVLGGFVREGAITDPFMTTKAYAKGDLVINNGYLYSALEDMEAGEWDATKWLKTNVAKSIPTKTSELTNDAGFLTKDNISYSVDITDDFVVIGSFKKVNGFNVTYYPNKKEVKFRGCIARTSAVTNTEWESLMYYAGTDIDFSSCALIGYNFGVSNSSGDSNPSVGCLFGYVGSTSTYSGNNFAMKKYSSGTSYGIGLQCLIILN